MSVICLRKIEESQGERGQAIVEMALALPLLVALLLGVIEIGRYAYLAIIVADAARTGAVYGAQNLVTAIDPTDIQTAAQTDANLGTSLSATSAEGPLPGGAVIPCTAVGSDTNNPHPYVVVNTTYTTQFLFSPAQFTLHGCAQMQVAQ